MDAADKDGQSEKEARRSQKHRKGTAVGSRGHAFVNKLPVSDTSKVNVCCLDCLWIVDINYTSVIFYIR